MRKSSVPFGFNPFDDMEALFPTLALAFDVGGNYGQTVQALRTVFPAAKIISFEPVPAIFDALKQTTSKDHHVECIACAVGETAGWAIMTNLEHTGQNTLNTAAKPGAPTVSVPIIALDDFCAERGIDWLDLLKIDTEGYEMAVLKGAKRMLKAGAIRAVLTECEFTPNEAEPHGDFFAIANLLMPLGYRVVAFYSGGVNGRGWLWGDVLFMRPERDLPVTCSPDGLRGRMKPARHVQQS